MWLTELLDNVEIDNNECWVWQRGKTSAGYGVYKQQLVHRLSHELWVGPIPEGLFVLHKCDNRPCLNPDHLYAGSAKDNVHDAMDRGRWVSRFAGETCYRGHQNWYTAPGTGKRYCRTCYNDNKRGM